MKRLLSIAGSALVGLAICLVFIWLTQIIGFSVHFPAAGGEDDFSLRAAYFFFGVAPSFLLLGAWIGYISAGRVQNWLAMWAGVTGGGICAFAAMRIVRVQIESLVEGGSANHGVLAFFLLWVVFSVVGACIGRKCLRNNAV